MMHKWKVSLFLMVGALGLIFLTTGSAYAACPEGMTSYWKLDEATPALPGGTYEDSFNGNDGTGAANPTAVTGIVNGGQEFNGTDTKINVPADRSFDWYVDDSFSIEYWVKRAADPALSVNEVVVGRDDSSTQLHWWVGIKATGEANFTLGSTSADPNNWFQITGDKDIVDGEWHYIVVIRDADANELRIYVDGIEDATAVGTTYSAGFDSTSANVNIGWLNRDPFYYFQGVVDEIAIYGRALTLAEIQDHYNNGTGKDYCPGGRGPFPEELTSYWKLDEATPALPGGTYEDSFNGNDGTGAANPTAVTGIVNGGQEFNGTDTKINVPADRSFDWYVDDSFSIEYWVKRAADPALGVNEVVVGRDDSSTQLHWWAGIKTTGQANFTLGSTSADPNNWFQITGDKDIVDGEWHYIVVIRDADANELRIYVDGIEDATAVGTTYSAGFDSTSANVNIGWLNQDPFYYFQGVVDEIAIYGRALTLAEIEKHHTDGLAGKGIDYVAPGDGDGDGGGGGGGGGGCFIATVAK